MTEQNIVITDKRELKRLAAQAKEQLEAEQVNLAMNPATLADDSVGDGVSAIEALRAKVANGTASEQEKEEFLRMQAEAEPEPTEPGIDCLTAFYVVIGHDGGAVAFADEGQTINVDRQPTIDDYYSACALVQRDIQNALAGRASAQAILQQTQVLAQQQAQSAAANLAQHGIDPRQLRRR